MDEAKAETEEITKSKEFERFDLVAYKRELFSMFAGEKTDITLSFHKELSDIIADRFGEITPTADTENSYLARVTVRVCNNFYAWLTAFEGKIKIVKPENIRHAYKAFLANNINNC